MRYRYLPTYLPTYLLTWRFAREVVHGAAFPSGHRGRANRQPGSQAARPQDGMDDKLVGRTFLLSVAAKTGRWPLASLGVSWCGACLSAPSCLNFLSPETQGEAGKVYPVRDPRSLLHVETTPLTVHRRANCTDRTPAHSIAVNLHPQPHWPSERPNGIPLPDWLPVGVCHCWLRPWYRIKGTQT